jgi:hypothetical protein
VPLVDPLPADADARVAELSAFFNETLGFTPNSVLTMQRRPEIAQAIIALNRAVMANRGRVSSEQKRLIGLLASSVAGSAERLTQLWAFRSSELFGAAERAAFEYAIAAASVPNAVTPAIEAALHAHWDDGEIVEITGVIALFGFLNRWNDAMSTTLEAPAAAVARDHLASAGWSAGKHGA